jgi:sugar/nucleoside kinase (ribokinase family)
VETLAVKLGARGALGVRGGQQIYVPSIPVQVADTVGAGDSFDAGFIYGYLHGWSLEKALRFANACGALSTTGYGGTAAQPTAEQALSFIERAAQ